MNSYEFVPIGSTLFMIETHGVHKFVHYNSLFKAAIIKWNDLPFACAANRTGASGIIKIMKCIQSVKINVIFN